MFSYSPEERQRMVDHICGQLSEGRALTRIVVEDKDLANLPSITTIIKWQSDDEDVAAQIGRAREAGVETLIDEMLEISDNVNGDAYIEQTRDGPVAKIDGEAIQRSKLRIYAREKYAQMIAPRKYGPRVDVTSGGEKLEAPTTTINDNRVQSLIAIALDRRRQDDEMRKIMDD